LIIVNTLIANKANEKIPPPDKEGFHTASEKGKLSSIIYLLSEGTNINSVDGNINIEII